MCSYTYIYIYNIVWSKTSGHKSRDQKRLQRNEGETHQTHLSKGIPSCLSFEKPLHSIDFGGQIQASQLLMLEGKVPQITNCPLIIPKCQLVGTQLQKLNLTSNQKHKSPNTQNPWKPLDPSEWRKSSSKMDFGIGSSWRCSPPWDPTSLPKKKRWANKGEEEVSKITWEVSPSDLNVSKFCSLFVRWSLFQSIYVFRVIVSVNFDDLKLVNPSMLMGIKSQS